MKRTSVILTLCLAVSVLSLPAVADNSKDSYFKKADQELKTWNAKVDQLQKNAERAGTVTRRKVEQAMPAIRQNFKLAQKKLTELQRSGGSGWKKLRREAEEALRNAQDSYQKATQFFSKSEIKQEEP